jgi:hypothetical protein
MIESTSLQTKLLNASGSSLSSSAYPLDLILLESNRAGKMINKAAREIIKNPC